MPHRARLWQVPALVAVLRRSTRGRPVWSDLSVMARATRRGWVRVVRDRHGVAGFAIRDGAALHALYVHPRAQGGGVGRALLADAKQAAGCLDLWVVQYNRHARRFYIRAGFAEKARAPWGGGNDENLPDILMVWPPERRAET
jgi:GNAT superfamily N-acetyltransferase